jgi:hypothetical protein
VGAPPESSLTVVELKSLEAVGNSIGHFLSIDEVALKSQIKEWKKSL